MSVEEEVYAGGGSSSRGGRGGQRRSVSPSGGSNDEAQITFNRRLQLLSDAGAGGLFQLDNDLLSELILNTTISDGEMLQSFYSALDETHKNSAVDYLKGMKKESQRFFWNALPDATRNELNQFGYELPQKDKIDWWNPWDWKDFFDEEVGSEFKKNALSWYNPIDAIKHPKKYFGTAAKTIAKNPWLGVTAPISLIGAAGSYIPRKTIEGIDWLFHNVGGRAKRGFAVGMDSMTGIHPNDLLKPFQGVVKYWDNAKHAETTYSDETINAIKDQLNGNETLYEQLLYTQRYGDISEGIFRYYLDENGGDQIDARKSMERFLSSGVLNSTSWRGAERYAMAGNITYGGLHMDAWDDLVLQIPPYFGGARREDLWGFEGLETKRPDSFQGYETEVYDEEAKEWVNGEKIIRGVEYYDSRQEALSHASNFYDWNRKAIGVTFEIIGSITFDPTNAGLMSIAKIRHARSSIRMGNNSTLQGYQGAVQTEREAASAIRALDELQEAVEMGVPAYKAASEVGQGSRLTRGIFNGTDGSRKSVKGVLKTWAEKSGDTYFRNTSRWRKEELRSEGRKVDQINEAFAKHELWLVEQRILQAAGKPSHETTSPLVELIRKDPRFESVIEGMERWHHQRKTAIGTQDTEIIDVLDEAGNVIKTERVFVEPTDFNIPVKKPGLDEWDGWWDFVGEQAGYYTMTVALNQRHQSNIIFPRISWGGILKNRAFLSARTFMSKGDSLQGLRGGIWADSVMRHEAISQRMIGDAVYTHIQTEPHFSKALKAITHDEIWSATIRPQYFEEHAKSLAKKWQLSDDEVVVLQELITAQRNKATRKLHEMYDAVILKGDDLDDYIKANFGDPELSQIMKDNWVHIDEFWQTHYSNHGVPKFDKDTGQLLFPANWWRNWGRQGKAYAERRRRGLLTKPGSVENEHLLRFPNEVTKTTTQTWDELYHAGIDVGKARHNLNSAKIATPDELMQLLETQGIKWVAEELKMSVKDLKSFIKSDLHLYYVENKMYNAAGKLRDFGLAVAYQTMYKPMQWTSYFFKNAPQKNTINVNTDFMNNHEMVGELKSLVDMGTLGGVPTTVIDQYISRFLYGTEGQRMNIINEFLYDVMGRSGGFAYGRKKALDIFNEYALSTQQAYSNIGQDLFLGKSGLTVGAMLPAEAHAAQLTKLKLIPDWRQVGRMTQHMGLLRNLGYRFGIAQLDLFFQKFWRPKVLLKLGVAPRNFFDEALQMGLRHGFGAQVDTRLAITAAGRISQRDEYGRIFGAQVGDVAWTKEQIIKGDRQALLRQLAGVQPVAQSNIALLKFPAIVSRKFLDVMQMGNKAIHKKAEKAAIAREGGRWDKLPSEEKDAIVRNEMIKLYQEESGFVSEAAMHTQFVLEWKLQEMLPNAHLTSKLSPFDPAISDKIAVANKILEMRGVSGAKQREGVYHALNNPVVMEAVTESLMRPLAPYMDDAKGTDLVVRHGGDTHNRNIMYRLEMDPSRIETKFYTETRNSRERVEGALQQMNWMKDEPAAVEMGVELAHHIDEPMNLFFRDIVPPGYQAPWRKTGKPALPQGTGMPPHVPDIDIKNVDTGVGSSIHRATDSLKNVEGKLEIHLDFGVLAKQYKAILFNHKNITKGPNAVALKTLGYNPSTFVKGLSELNLTAGHSSVPETFLNALNVERAKMGMAPKKAGDVLEEAEPFYLYSFERQLAAVRLQHYDDAVSASDLVKANQIALQQLGVGESAALSSKVPLAHPVTRIISGGQSGADIAGVRAGRALQIETGGVAPVGKTGKLSSSKEKTKYGKLVTDEEMRDLGITEVEGPIPEDGGNWGEYYMRRTKANIDASDGTVIFTQPNLPKTIKGRGVSGTERTIKYATDKADYPDPLIFNAEKFTDKDKTRLLKWLKRNNIQTLNVAGPRQHVVEMKWQTNKKNSVVLSGKFGKGNIFKAAAGSKSKTLFEAVVKGERNALIAPKSTEVRSDTVRGMERDPELAKGVSPLIEKGYKSGEAKILPIDLNPGLLERFGEGELLTITSGKEKVLVRVISKKPSDEYKSRELAKKLGYEYDTRTQNWDELAVSHTVIEFEVVAEDLLKTAPDFESSVQKFLTDSLSGGARTYVPPAPTASGIDLQKNLEAIEELGGQLDYYPQSIQGITLDDVDNVVEWQSPFGASKPEVTVLGEVGTDYYYTYHHYHIVDEGKPVGTVLRSKGNGTKGSTKHVYVQGGWDPVIQDVKNQVEAITGYEFDTVIVQKYARGNVDLGFHYDKETGTWPAQPEAIIASVNLGATRDFVFRPRTYIDKTGKRVEYSRQAWNKTSRKEEHVPFELNDKDVFLMREGTQDAWEHSLMRRKGNVGPRINLTFRRRNPAIQKKSRGDAAVPFRGEDVASSGFTPAPPKPPAFAPASPPPPEDPSSQFARAAYDKVTEMGVRSHLREFYENVHTFEQGTMRDEVNLLIKNIKKTVGITPSEEKFIRGLLTPSDKNVGYVHSNALAWLVNYRVNPEALVGGRDLQPIVSRQVDRGVKEFTTISGQDRLRSLKAHGGHQGVMLPVPPDRVEIFLPQINGDAALHLGYLFEAARGPMTIELRNALKGFLVKELGTDKLAIDALNMLNPMNNPYGSTLPSAWLERNVPKGGSFLGQLISNNPSNGSPGTFVPLGRHTGVQQQTVIGLTGSHNSEHAQAISRAVEKWNEWIYQSGGQIGSQMLDDALNPMGPFKSLPSVRRLYSKGEYQADIGFGRQFGSSQGINLPRGGYGQDVSRPPSVYIAGEGWADKKSVPLGWVEERADGVPTGKWIPDETPMPSEFEPTGIIGLETELEARNIRFPTTPQSPEKLATTLDRREYLEEEIINLAHSLLSLPSGSKVTYPFSATASYQRWKGDLPYYDDFGFTLNRLIKIVNDHGASSTSTIADLEREIWQILGDLPTVSKGIADLPYIGTVGGVKHDGVRRIFTDFEPTDLVPNLEIKGNPVGDITQFDSDILKPWNMSYEEVQWMHDDPSLIVGDTIEQLAQRDIGFEQDVFWNYARPDEQFFPAAGLSTAKPGDVIPPRGVIGRKKTPETHDALFQAGVKDVEEYMINRISGMPEEKLAAFLKWRQQQIDEAIQAGHVDAVWPFFRNPSSATFDYDGAAKTILRNPDPQDYPVSFKETAKELKAKNIPIDETAQQNMPTRTAAIVKSKLRTIAESDTPRALWTYDSERAASLRPSDIGGFHHGIDLVGVNPKSVGPNDIETVMDSHNVFHVWEHTKTKDIHILPDTAYNPTTKELNIPVGFNPKDYKSIGSFEAGSNDMAQFTRVQTEKIKNEMNHLLTTHDRVEASGGAQVNHPMLLELTGFPKDAAMSEARLVTHSNDGLLPQRMLHTMPAGAPKTGAGGAVMSGIKHLERAFFGGYMHPVIKAGIREPMFLWYFSETWATKSLGITEFYQHSANAFKFLETTLLKEVPNWLLPSRLSPHHKAMHNGVEQFDIPELRTFIETFRNRRKAEDVTAVFADVVDDWMSGVKDKNLLLEQVFDLPKGEVRIGNDYGLPGGGNLKGTHSLSKAYGNNPDEALRDALANRNYYDVEINFKDKGLFHRVFAGNEEQFFHLKETLPTDEYNLFIRSIMEWMSQQLASHHARVDFAMLDSAKRMSHYVDMHTKRSFFQEMVGSAIPFHFAHFQFLSRWAKTIEHNPAAIPRLNWLLFAAVQTGYRYEDERTGQMRLKIPFTETGVGIFLEVMNSIPIVQKFFGSKLLSVFEDGVGFPERFILPGYDPDNLLEFQLGPILGIPLTAASHVIGPQLLNEGLLGVGENLVMNRTYDEPLVNSIFGQLLPTTFVRPFAAVLNAFGGSDIAGLYSKAEADAVMILGLKGMLPDQADMAGRPGEEVFNQNWYEAISHIAKVKMVMDMVTWQIVGTSSRSTILSSDAAWEWNELMQRGIDMGMPHEEAFEYMLDQAKEDFDANFAIEYPNISTDDSFYWDEWNREITRIGTTGVGATEKITIADLPMTVAAWEWLTTGDNQEWVLAAPLVHSFFIPRGFTEEETLYAQFARDWQLGEALRWDRTTEEIQIAIQSVAPSVEYYQTKEAHLRQLNIFREARDSGRRNDIKPGVSWADMIMMEEESWDSYDATFKERYPIWAENTFGLDSQHKRKETLDEMRRLFTSDNIDAIPDSPHKTDILSGMKLIINLDNALIQLSGVRGSNDKGVKWTSIRNNLILDTYNEFSALVAGRPWLNTMFYNLLLPFIGEDWVIKLEEGTLDLGVN